ncbi:hypothetical protein BB559_005636 [Furculomyces boomerangus]|uniref:ATP-dependent DNA helicase n=1 Tax=Furculomyces boomerangus TaxID=61424 RepID=A0A2T9Y7H4_9FUNG|nr:hypothetical protein BB559_005636 [Furculomyces boomerangus]
MDTSIKLVVKNIINQITNGGFDYKQLFYSNEFDSYLVEVSESLIVENEFINECDLWDKLNGEQIIVAEEIYKALVGQAETKCFYVDGPAWTGIAAILLPGGVTCHSAFSLPLDLSKAQFSKLGKKKGIFENR